MMRHVPSLTWRQIAVALAVAAVATPNVYLVSRSLQTILTGGVAVDWHHFVEASRRVHEGGLYDTAFDYGYRYSPIMAYVFGALAPLGEFVWRGLHLAAAFALPSWPMRIVALLSWPFWFDVEAGNLMIFIVLAAVWALRGSHLAIAAFLILTILVPRPLMLPVAGWLLWTRSEWRIPFALLFLIHAALVGMTGWGAEWLATLIQSGDEARSPLNLGPSRLIGLVWLIVGVPLAGFLTWRGRLGWASLVVSPYWLPYYLLMPIVELARPRPASVSAQRSR